MGLLRYAVINHFLALRASFLSFLPSPSFLRKQETIFSLPEHTDCVTIVCSSGSCVRVLRLLSHNALARIAGHNHTVGVVRTLRNCIMTQSDSRRMNRTYCVGSFPPPDTSPPTCWQSGESPDCTCTTERVVIAAIEIIQHSPTGGFMKGVQPSPFAKEHLGIPPQYLRLHRLP